jgi:RNA polymerase sigma-70 factor (ECF subfamily)
MTSQDALGLTHAWPLTTDSEGAGVSTQSSTLGALYREHSQALASYLLRRTACRHATEDLLAEVFLAALRGLPKYQDRGLPLRAWLYGIATRQVRRWRRRKRHVLPLEDAREVVDPQLSGAEAAAAQDEARRAFTLLQRLPTRFQEVLVLHHLEGLSMDEIALALSIRPGTAKSRLSRARERLRKILEEKDP